MADENNVVQPDEGQGDSTSPYQEYLERLPEDVRPQVEPVFREWDGNVTKRFQDHSQFRQQWEPYQEAGVHNLPPDEVKQLLEFREALLTNPEGVKQWFVNEYAPANNLTLAEQQAVAAQQNTPAPDEFGFVDPNIALEQTLASKLSPLEQQLQQLTQWQQQQEQQSRLAEATRLIESQKAELKEKHPDVYDEQRVNALLAQYIETDPQNAVRRAFDDWQAIVSQVQKQTLQQKVDQPPPAESGGVANGAPDGIRTLEEASRIALEQLRQANNA